MQSTDDLFDWLGLPPPQVQPRIIQVSASQRPSSTQALKALAAPPRSSSKTDQASKLRALADSMEKAIDAKMNPPISKQRTTRRRTRIASGMREEGRQMELVQTWLYRLADAWDAGNVLPLLSRIDSRSPLYQFTMMLASLWRYPDPNSSRHAQDYSFQAVDDIWTSGHSSDQGRCKILVGIGITNGQMTWDAMMALKSLAGPSAIDPKKVKIEQMLNDLIGTRIPGYFPTPKPIAQMVIDLAGIRDGMRVLEPHGGSGSLCDAMKAKYPNVVLEVVEIDFDLREILELKGYNIIGHDFLAIQDVLWDRIIANPPFENLADIDHTLHAFDRLLPNGRLVTIMSTGWTFRKDKKAEDFRDWVNDVGGDWELLPEGAFYESDRPTGVRTGILVVNK